MPIDSMELSVWPHYLVEVCAPVDWRTTNTVGSFASAARVAIKTAFHNKRLLTIKVLFRASSLDTLS